MEDFRQGTVSKELFHVAMGVDTAAGQVCKPQALSSQIIDLFFNFYLRFHKYLLVIYCACFLMSRVSIN
jgi:hypothetical protein